MESYGLSIKRKNRFFNPLFLVLLLKFTSLFYFPLFAQESSDTQKVTITGTVKDPKGAPLANVIVREKIGDTPSSNVVVTDTAGNFSITVSSSTLELQITYFGKSENILINGRKHIESVFDTQSISQQKTTVTGTIKDPEGYPLINATIKEKTGDSPSTNMAITDVDGNFSINVSSNTSELQISYLGKSKDVSINGRDYIELIFDNEIEELENVIVTGYQKISRERVTGSYVHINSETLDKMVTTSTSDRLIGLVSGLDVGPTGSVLIRGRGTRSNTNPLIVVDGFPLEDDDNLTILSTLNAMDIESITVLKDAVATSIYGARSGNGVIVIETKRAKGDNININFNYNLLVGEKLDFDSYNIMGTGDAVDFYLEQVDKGYVDNVLTTSSRSPTNAISEILYKNKYEGLSDEDAQRQIDALKNLPSDIVKNQYEDYFLRKSITQQYNLSIRGNNTKNKSNYSLSFKMDDYLRSSKNESNKKYYINVKYQITLLPRFVLDLGAYSYINKRENFLNSPTPAVLYNASLPFEPLFIDGEKQNIYNVSGVHYRIKNIADSAGFMENYIHYNPINEVGQNNEFYTQFLNRFQTRLSYGIGGFNFSLSYQHERSSDDYEKITKYGSFSLSRTITQYAYPGTDGKYIFRIPKTGNTFNNNSTNKTNNLLRGQMDYTSNFGDDHYIRALWVTEYKQVVRQQINNAYNYFYNEQTGRLSTVPSTYLQSKTNSILGRAAVGSITSLMSVYNYTNYMQYFSTAFNVGYTYKSRYNLTGNIRVDQTNVYDKDSPNRYKPLWSTGFSWNMERESFMSDIDYLDDLKLRISYGLTGLMDKNASSVYTMTVGSNSSLNGIDNATPNYINPYLKWEETNYTNLGVDFSFFKRQFYGSFELFRRYTKDMLTSNPIDPTNGATSMTTNNGELLTQGIDISLGGVLIDYNEFTWVTNFTYSYNYSEVKAHYIDFETVDLYDYVMSPMYYSKVGEPLYSIKYFDYQGLNKYGNAVVKTSEGYTIDASQKDLAKKLSVHDMLHLGRGEVAHFGGLTNTFSYKGFVLDANMTYNLGYYVLAINQQTIGYNSYLIDRWKESGDENITNVPALQVYSESSTSSLSPGIAYYNNLWYKNSKENIIDASHIRFNYLVLSYVLPRSIVDKIKLGSVIFNLQAKNLGVLWAANNRGIDPLYIGIPSPVREYSFGIRIKF